MRQPAQAPMRHGLEWRRSGAGISKTRLEKKVSKRKINFKKHQNLVLTCLMIAAGPNGWGITKVAAPSEVAVTVSTGTAGEEATMAIEL